MHDLIARLHARHNFVAVFCLVSTGGGRYFSTWHRCVYVIQKTSNTFCCEFGARWRSTMMDTRVRLLAIMAGQAACKPSSVLKLRCVHGSHSFSSPVTNHRRALMLLTTGLASIAVVYHSLRSPHDEFESAPVAPSTLPRSHNVDEANRSAACISCWRFCNSLQRCRGDGMREFAILFSCANVSSESLRRQCAALWSTSPSCLNPCSSYSTVYQTGTQWASCALRA